MLSQTNVHCLAISKLALGAAHIRCLRIMQSVFSPATRRVMMKSGRDVESRGGGLKTDWTKPRDGRWGYGY